MRPNQPLSFILTLLPLASAIWEFDLSKAQHASPTRLEDFDSSGPKTYSKFQHSSKYEVESKETSTYIPLPSTDTWYRAPDGWEDAKPGDVLKVRHHAYNTSLVPITSIKDVFQVLFRSTNSLSNPTWAVTTVFIPKSSTCPVPPVNGSTTGNLNATGNGNSTCIQGVVSYQLPYDTSCLDASPSFGLQFGEPYGELALMLARGWWVSVPDFEGPLASYGASIVAGYITVDSVRAVLSTLATEFSLPNTRVALWGYSNGASATEAAVEFATKYAPDLKISGAAIGGLAPNLIRSGPMITSTQVSGLLVQGIIGVTSQYPEQRKYILSRLKPEGPYNATEFFWASYMSGWQSLLYYSYVDVFQYFIGGQEDLLDPGLTAMFQREGTLGVFGVPNTKVFMYHAVEDDMTPVGETDAVVDKFCREGANILYHRNEWGGHNDELANGRQRSLDFLGDVLDGGKVLSFPASGCRWENVTVLQDPKKPFQ